MNQIKLLFLVVLLLGLNLLRSETPIATVEVTTPVDCVDLLLPEEATLPRRYKIKFDGVVSDRAINQQTGAVLTMFMGFGDPITWHEGINYSHYMSDGFREWKGEPSNPPGPLTNCGLPQRLYLGCRASIDTGTRTSLGSSGEIDVFCAGTISGEAQCQKVVVKGYRGMIGGMGGDSNFPNDSSVPYDWSALVDYVGHYTGNIGQIPTGFRFRMNGGNESGIQIIGGRFELYAEGEGIPYEEEEITYSCIGNFGAISTAFNGNANETCTVGAWTVGTSGWLGLAGSSAWSAAHVQIVGSNNDGFVYGHPSNATMTFQVYESDTEPAGPTDGTLVIQGTLADNDYSPSKTLNFTESEKIYRWVVVSHNISSTSVYVSEVIFY